MELHPGAVIASRYRADRKIGAGGMGEVWAGEHVSIGVRVALKTLLPAAALDRQIVARFRREAQLLGRLRSDRVARVVDFVEDPGFGLVLVMDFVEGELLGAVLGARRLGIEEALDLGVDIVTALCDLHRAKVVHRDLKPDNIILEPLAGGRRRAVIVDLGVGRLDAEQPTDEPLTSITHADTAVGTLPYMAPEQLLSSSTVTASADLYAVGAILYRAVSGEQVFGGDDNLAIRRKIAGEAPPLVLARIDRVAKGLSAVVAKALRRRPEQRFDSAEAMLEELSVLQDLSRAMSFDLEAATEEALPPSLVLMATPEEPPTAPMASSPAPDMGGQPATLGTLPVPQPDESACELTRPMSRPPVEEGDIFDEATQTSPASQALPRAESAPSAPVEAPPVPPAAPPSLAAPPTVDELPRPRTILLRTALIGLVAALAAGTLAGYEAHHLMSPSPPPADAHR
jgi:serine/threonine-protein kinase